MLRIDKDPIGMFQRMTSVMAKQRTDPSSSTSSSEKKSSLSGIIRDRIEISSPVKSEVDVQALTRQMTGKGFKSVKEYGQYFLDAFAKLKGSKS